MRRPGTEEGPQLETQGGGPSKPPEKWSLKNWLTLLLERAPPLVFLLLAMGPCLSGLQAVNGYIDLEKLTWGIIGQFVLLVLIRVMDEVKDYEKDKVVHPDRPLPRGLISCEEVVKVIHATLLSQLVYAALMSWRFNWEVGITYTLQVAFIFLMYVEFGIGEWLEKRPLLYGVSHQVCIYVGAMFICSLAGAPWYSSIGFLLGSVSFSGFFTYEICRKLDPALPKLKGTYLVIYGKWPTFLFTSVTVAIGVVSSYIAGLHWLLWPMEGLLIASLLILFLVSGRVEPGKKPKAHKPVEALAILYVLLHMWAPFVSKFFT